MAKRLDLGRVTYLRTKHGKRQGRTPGVDGGVDIFMLIRRCLLKDAPLPPRSSIRRHEWLSDFSLSSSGVAPSPFDALNGRRLSGPLTNVVPQELVRQRTRGLQGRIHIDNSPMVGRGITGLIELHAGREIDARNTSLRLCGVRIDEVSKKNRGPWGEIFSDHRFIEPAIPDFLAAGSSWSSSFAIPGPPFGPPSAHLGKSIIAWALQVHFDIELGGDAFIATWIPIAQNPTLLTTGIGDRGSTSMMKAVVTDGAQLEIKSGLPVKAGSSVAVGLTWPGAPKRSVGLVEMVQRSNVPGVEDQIVTGAKFDPAKLARGTVELEVHVPSDLVPSFEGAGLKMEYWLRAVLRRRLRSDKIVERPIALIE